MKQFHFLFVACVLLSIKAIEAQVSQKTIVEHFTNTKCSVCAASNPYFYTNLNKQQNTLHLSIYPSSPYSACLLHQHNASAGDARTNYYGVYGSTPRLVINGNVIPTSADYGSGALFAPYQSLMSPASIKIYQFKYGNDSIRSTVVIKTVAAHTLGSLSLFVGLAEDTVFYTGSNGEPKHFGVFRKPLSNTTGNAVTLPTAIGDSIVFSSVASANSVWNFKRIYTIVILQESSNKKLVQAEASEAKTNMAPTSLTENEGMPCFRVFPNPAQYHFTIESPVPIGKLKITNMVGQAIYEENLNQTSKQVDLSDRPGGIYFIQLSNSFNASALQKIVIMR